MAGSTYKPFCLEVWADFACFTRPEMKVERVSYDVPTPSAVRAVYEAILWKPAIRWQVNKIEVMNPIKWISVRRNEVGAVMSPRSEGLYIEENRQQRAGLFLRDVCYRFYATLEYIPPEQRSHWQNPIPVFLLDPEDASSPAVKTHVAPNQAGGDVEETPGKYLAMFERRARKGQCFTQPYLGCREFSCHFRWLDESSWSQGMTIDQTADLGFMLYDMDFTNRNNPQPMFFRLRMEKGVIHIPARDSEEVLR